MLTLFLEDWHHFPVSWFRRNGNFRVVPIFLFMGNDAIEDDNWLKANRARYTQGKAHAMIDLAYIVCQYVSCRHSIPFHKVTLFVHAEHHISWTLTDRHAWLTCKHAGEPQLDKFFRNRFTQTCGFVFSSDDVRDHHVHDRGLYIRSFLVHDRSHFEANAAPMWWQVLSQI